MGRQPYWLVTCGAELLYLWIFLTRRYHSNYQPRPKRWSIIAYGKLKNEHRNKVHRSVCNTFYFFSCSNLMCFTLCKLSWERHSHSPGFFLRFKCCDWHVLSLDVSRAFLGKTLDRLRNTATLTVVDINETACTTNFFDWITEQQFTKFKQFKFWLDNYNISLSLETKILQFDWFTQAHYGSWAIYELNLKAQPTWAI